MARAALADMEVLRRVEATSRPVTLAEDRLLPVGEAFASLLPDGGLRRGSTVSISGSVGATSLALGLVAEASRAGSWTAVVAMPWLGFVAAGELGVDLARVAVIDDPGEQWTTVVASLVGAFDVVLTGPARARGADGRRLIARLRERGTVLVQVDTDPYAVAGITSRRRRPPSVTGDVTLTTGRCEWEGLADGHGHLTGRRVEVRLGGRGAAARGGSSWIWLPGSDGGVRIDPTTASIDRDRLITTPEDVVERLHRLRALPGGAGRASEAGGAGEAGRAAQASEVVSKRVGGGAAAG